MLFYMEETHSNPIILFYQNRKSYLMYFIYNVYFKNIKALKLYILYEGR